MELNALYTVEFPENTLIFTESASGTLDFDSSAHPQTSRIRVSELLGSDREPRELVFSDDWLGKPLYHRAGNIRGRVYRYGEKDGLPLHESVFGFLARFFELYSLFLSGDYAGAGRMLQFSKKLRGFKGLVRHILGKDLFFAFLFYFLNDFSDDKEKILTALLGGRFEHAANYREVFEYARPFVEAKSAAEFDKEAKEKIERLLFVEKKRLVLPIVGSNYRQIIGEISSTLASARESGERKSIVEGLSARDIESRIRGYVDDFSVHLTAEPYNPYDANAVAVMVRDRSGYTSHAGYLKREAAAFFARLSATPSSLKARLFRVTGRGADIEVWAE